MSGMNDVAKEVGLNPIKLESGPVVDTSELLTAFFDEIMARCAKGEKVRVAGFGTFHAVLYKGRTLESPLVPGGKTAYGDTLVLKFKQSQAAKVAMNAEGTVDAYKDAQTGPVPPEKPKAAKKDGAKKSSKKKGVKTAENDGEPKKDKKKGSKKGTKKGSKKSAKKSD